MLAAAALLVVRLYDTFGVSASDLELAQATARAAMHTAGIEVAWRDCSRSGACDEVLKPGELMVRIAPATSASVADSLGYSFVMAGAGQGILATVFADRVSALAHSARVDAGELLGRALAHEVGHMLLGRADHPSEGLMRGLWTVADLQRNHPHDWTWSRQERHDLRRALEIRTRGVATPVATLAD